ncbi:MAG: hypothetical protein L0Y58_00120 [Verrucomicrobia subdivision 3 bacterium]|nr:hypothetical protein [Limisphaerales bacterium]
MKTLFTLAILWPVVLLAHIGSPNVFYEGSAGPYALRVIIQPPDVIPGLARITVRALASNVSKISVLPARWDTGTKGAPSPDPAKPVRGDANLFAAELWLMTGGAYSIIVNAEGASGTGTTVVPINSVATARRVMPRWFGGLLGAWGGALVLALISLIGAATRESVLSPGETPSRGRICRARATMVLGTGVIGLALWGGKVWWDAVDRDYRNNKLYRADRLYAEVRTNNSQAILELTRNVDRWGARPIIPEHGKLMHMFLVRQPDLEAFAHLHPVKTGEHSFESALPPVPAGKYRIYADITHESGFTQTLVSEVSLGADANATSFTPTDPDDSWRIGRINLLTTKSAHCQMGSR